MEDSTSDVFIHLGDTQQRSCVKEKPNPAQDLSTYAAVYGNVADGNKQIFISASAIRAIEEHAESSPANEVGGVLLGDSYISGGIEYTQIDEYLKAQNASEKRANLTFTHETWSKLNAERELSHPDLRIVGWYHTHPGLGVFLSDSDKFIHKNFFSDESQVALVIDPTTSNRAFFNWSGGLLVKSTGFCIFDGAFRGKNVDDLIRRLQPRKPESKAAVSVPPAGVTEVKIIFSEPCINTYYALPGFLRPIFGLTSSQTAPRISIKNIIITALICVVVYQGVELNSLHASDVADIYSKQAMSFYNIGHYADAFDEFRRAQSLNPENAENYIYLMKSSAHQADMADEASKSDLVSTLDILMSEANEKKLRFTQKQKELVYKEFESSDKVKADLIKSRLDQDINAPGNSRLNWWYKLKNLFE